MRTERSVLLVLISLVLIACEPPIQNEEEDSSSHISDPVVTSFTYTHSGATVTESAPFTVARNIYPDVGTGLCDLSPNAQIVLQGTFDSENTAELILTGPISQNASLSGDTFSIQACLASGSALLSLKAVGADGKSSQTVKVSLNNVPTLTTLAYGHPTYPNPGFRVEGVRAGTSSLNTSTLKSRQFSVSDVGAQTIISTGNTSLTLSTGFVNIVKEISP